MTEITLSDLDGLRDGRGAARAAEVTLPGEPTRTRRTRACT